MHGRIHNRYGIFPSEHVVPEHFDEVGLSESRTVDRGKRSLIGSGSVLLQISSDFQNELLTRATRSLLTYQIPLPLPRTPHTPLTFDQVDTQEGHDLPFRVVRGGGRRKVTP